MRLVSLHQASDHLRRDTDADDADLEVKVEAASELVMEYISDASKEGWTDSAGDPFPDSNGDALDVPRRVQLGTLTLIGYLYNERDGSNDSAVPTQWGYGYLPIGVTALLFAIRKPTVV